MSLRYNSSADDPDGNGVTTGTEIYITSAEEGYTVETAILENVCSMGFRNRGVKRKDFSVIATCKNYGVSSALLESCFIDDQDDVDLLVPNIGKLAQKVVDGIAGGFGLKASSGSNTSTGRPAAAALPVRKVSLRLPRKSSTANGEMAIRAKRNWKPPGTTMMRSRKK